MQKEQIKQLVDRITGTQIKEPNQRVKAIVDRAIGLERELWSGEPAPGAGTMTPAETAAWWPVPITSARVSRLGMSAGSGSMPTRKSVPSARGTRTFSPWAPSAKPSSRTSAPHQPPVRHEVETPLAQFAQVPSQT